MRQLLHVYGGERTTGGGNVCNVRFYTESVFCDETSQLLLIIFYIFVSYS